MPRQGSGANEGFWMVVTVRQVQGHVLSEVPDNLYMLYSCTRIWNNKGKSRSSNQFDDHDIYSHQSSHQVKYWDYYVIPNVRAALHSQVKVLLLGVMTPMMAVLSKSIIRAPILAKFCDSILHF